MAGRSCSSSYLSRAYQPPEWKMSGPPVGTGRLGLPASYLRLIAAGSYEPAVIAVDSDETSEKAGTSIVSSGTVRDVGL